MVNSFNSKKIQFDRLDYKSISWYISQKMTENRIHAAKG